MAAHTPTTSTRRRDLLGAAGFTALAGIAAVAIAKPDVQNPTSPALAGNDAELIAIGQEAADLIEQREPLGARWWTLPPIDGTRTKGKPGHDEMNAVAAALEPIDRRLDELVDRAKDLPAASREAMAAKAHLIRYEMRMYHSLRGEMLVDELEPHEHLVWSLLDDVLGAQS